MISVRLAGQFDSQPASACGRNFQIAIFLDSVNMINVQLCMMVALSGILVTHCPTNSL